MIDQVEPVVFRVREVARLLDLSQAAVYRLIERGEIPAVHLGRTVRVPRRAFAEWLERRSA